MKIIEQTEERTVPLKEVPLGSVFKFGEMFYVKCYPVKTEFGETLEGINLSTGEYLEQSDHIKVIVCSNATLHVDGV